MLLVSIEIKDEKPMAFKGREDIEYVLLQLMDVSFTTWAHTVIASSFQINKGNRDLSGILYTLFTKVIKMSPDVKVMVKKEDMTGWVMDHGYDEDNDIKTWSLEKYKKELKI